MRSQFFTAREKSLALVAGILLVVMIVVGYTKSATAEGSANSLVAMEDTSSEDTSSSEDDVQSARNSYDERVQEVEQWERELADYVRNDATLDTTTAQKAIDDFRALLVTGLSYIDAGDTAAWWDIGGDFDDLRYTFNDATELFRNAEDWVNVERSCKNQTRELERDIARQVKDLTRELGRLKSGDQTRKTQLLSEIEQYCGAPLQTFLTQLQPYCSGRQGETQDYWDIDQNINYAKQDCYDRLNEGWELNGQLGCFEDVSRRIKDKDRNVIREYERAVKRIGIENLPIAVKSSYDAFLNAYAAAERELAIDCEVARDILNDGGYHQQDFWDAMNELNEQENNVRAAKDVGRDIEHRTKEYEKMQKEYERVLKKNGGSALPNAKKHLDEFARILELGRAVLEGRPQDWWDEGYNEDLNDIQNLFWERLNRVQAARDVSRWLKDVEREIKHREKEIQQIGRDGGREVAEELEEIWKRMRDIVAAAQSKLQEDPEEARSELESMDELRWQWDELTHDFYNSRERNFSLAEFKREIEGAEHFLERARDEGRVSDSEFSACREIVDEAYGLLEDADGIDEIHEKFEEIDERAQEVCPIFNEYGGPERDHDYYANFAQEHLDEIDTDLAAGVLERVSDDVAQRVLQKLLRDPSSIAALMQSGGDRYGDNVAKTLEAATNFYDDETQRQLIAQKQEILELTRRLEEAHNRLRIAQEKLERLQQLQDEIAAYNFYGEAGDVIRNQVEQFVEAAESNSLTDAQVEARLVQLQTQKDEAIQRSVEEKHKQGIIPFRDTDDNAWYTRFVKSLADRGIVAGKGDGRFDPGADVTVAEITTMAFRVSGDAEPSGDSELCDGRYVEHWGNKFLRWGEERGVSLLSSCENVDRRALRWEVVQMLLEATGQDIARTDERCFNDVDPRDSEVNSVMCAGKALGIVAGSNGDAKPYDPINRAEATTIVKAAGERLFGISFANTNNQRSAADQGDDLEELDDGKARE